MLIVELLVNQNLVKAEVALSQANSGNIIELCRQYLLSLTKYRDELSKLRGIPEINFRQSSSLARELTEQVRKAIRSVIEITTRERNQTKSLLNSFTSISGYEAVDTFNRLKYKGFDNWELCSSGVHSKDYADDKLMTIQEAVDKASLLRRDAYIAQKVTFLK
jgi:hypothetical protein